MSSIKLKEVSFLIPIIISFTFLISCERDEVSVKEPTKIDNSCDTTNVSFSLVVQPIILPCKPCHNSSDTYAGVNLDGYDNIRKHAQNGSLIESIKGGTMSTYFNGSDCDLVKIEAWINQGIKNN